MRQKRKSLKRKIAEGSMKPSGQSRYAKKKSWQKKGKYSSESPITF